MVKRGFTFEMALQEFFVLRLFAHEKCFVTTKRTNKRTWGGGWATLLQQKSIDSLRRSRAWEENGKENQTKNRRGWEIQAKTEKSLTFQRRRENLRQNRDSREGISFPAWCDGTGASTLSSFLSSLKMNFIFQVNNVHHYDHLNTVKHRHPFSQVAKAKLKLFNSLGKLLDGVAWLDSKDRQTLQRQPLAPFNPTSLVSDLQPVLFNVCLTKRIEKHTFIF